MATLLGPASTRQTPLIALLLGQRPVRDSARLVARGADVFARALRRIPVRRLARNVLVCVSARLLWLRCASSVVPSQARCPFRRSSFATSALRGPGAPRFSTTFR